MTSQESASTRWLDANEIKKQVSIKDVLASYGHLEHMTERGTSLAGPSPFHEGEQSLRVQTERQIWNDMNGRPNGDNGRPVAGNVLGLIQALEGCSFRRALEIAATRFVSTEDARGEVAAALRDEATSTPPTPAFGKELRGLRHDVPLLTDLGISPKTAKAYGVGAGIRGMMKGLLACPVRSLDGTIQGYAGRRLGEANGALPTWKNPPGLRISDHLFGLHRSLSLASGRKAIEEYGLILVQSPVDVLKLAEHRYLNCVALMGPQLSETQRDLITNPSVNPTRRITLSLNNSEIGAKGKRSAARMLIERAFVRYASWSALQTEQTSPAHLSRDQLRELLSLTHTGTGDQSSAQSEIGLLVDQLRPRSPAAKTHAPC